METKRSDRQTVPQLEKDGSFAVREYRSLDLIVAGIFYLLFLTGVGNVIGNYKADQQRVYNKIILLTLLPAVGYTVKAFKKRTYILINTRGIYINNNFVTNWDNFVSARYLDLQVTGSIKDNFVLELTYYKEDGICYKRKVPEVNTQNKAEEEVIGAIKYFYGRTQGDPAISNQI